MGIFDKFFGARKVFSPLEPNDPLAKHLDGIKKPLEELASLANDSLEVVPAGKATYVFIGNPPKQFGIAWVRDGKVFNLKSLADEKGLSATTLRKTSDNLSNAYKRSENETRYSATVGDCALVVTASEALAQDVDRIIQTVSV